MMDCSGSHACFQVQAFKQEMFLLVQLMAQVTIGLDQNNFHHVWSLSLLLVCLLDQADRTFNILT